VIGSLEREKVMDKYNVWLMYIMSNCNCYGGVYPAIAQPRKGETCIDPLWQRQKRIQNQNRVSSSEYIMNLGAVSAYQSAAGTTMKLNWNQSSDRANASVSKLNMRPAHRPGAGGGGAGSGVDVKHNSYDRYLRRLKGGNVLRKQGNSAYGVTDTSDEGNATQGGKYVKFNMVGGCNC
jgi:hypothetical protein